MTLSSADFEMFFQAIHGHSPFPWQQTLVDRLDREDRWPDILDLPTGAGKTAALDAAVFHLALRADTPTAAALRIVLVVDRRLVVDDAYRRAQKIERALTDPSQTRVSGRTVVEEVARRLQLLSGTDAPPLVAAPTSWRRTAGARLGTHTNPAHLPLFHRRSSWFATVVPWVRRVESYEAGSRRPPR